MTEDKSSERIVEDGAVCEHLYRNEKCKIVHLLKEPTKEGESLAKVIENKVIQQGRVRGTIFKVVARRSYCIQNGFPTWVELERLERKESRYVDALRRSAIVNMGPEPGGYSTEAERLEQLGTKWKERWYEGKLKVLEPNIVICGGTFAVVVKTLKVAEEHLKQVATGMRYWVDRGLNAVFVNCYHPSFRGNHTVEYCYFRESCRCLSKIGELQS